DDSPVEAHKPSPAGSREGNAFFLSRPLPPGPHPPPTPAARAGSSPACSVKSKVESRKSTVKSKVQNRKSKVKHGRVTKSSCPDCSRSCCVQPPRAQRRFGERSLTPP